MIPQSIINEIKQLLADESLSQRKIAKRMGVSRGTVGAIASGRRRDYVKPPAADGDDNEEPAGPPERCASCGAMVYAPCRSCRLRRLLATERIPRRPERSLGPTRLELSDDHRLRYERVRARCRRNGELILER